MAKRNPDLKGLMFVMGVFALVLDVAKATDHKRTCPKCLGRDYVEIALDVLHLWGS